MIEKEALLDIFADDKTILMIGSKGNGKTNGASVFMETLVEDLGYEIWTNIHFFEYENIGIAIKRKKLPPSPDGHRYVEKHPRIHVISTLSEAILGTINSGPRGKAFFLDEAGIHASSGRVTSKSTNTIKDLNKIIRHFESCFILIAQMEGDVPPNLREKDCDYRFDMRKIRSKFIVEIGIKKELKNEETGEKYIDFPVAKKFQIPLTKYPFDGKFPSGFEVDINLKETLDELSKVGDSIEIMHKGKGRKIIEEMLRKQMNIKQPKASKKDMIKSEFYNDTGLTLRGLAKKYKTSYQYVKNIHIDFLQEAE